VKARSISLILSVGGRDSNRERRRRSFYEGAYALLLLYDAPQDFFLLWLFYVWIFYQQLCRCPDGREGRLQFVARVGHEVTPRFLKLILLR
jgi:hypothetical protein